MTKFEIWLEKINKERKEYWETNFTHKPYEPLKVEKGRKYIKLIDDMTVWGFVSMIDGINKGVSIKKGDLLMPVSWNSPAKHSRGNIFEGTDSWEYHGVSYKK